LAAPLAGIQAAVMAATAPTAAAPPPPAVEAVPPAPVINSLAHLNGAPPPAAAPPAAAASAPAAPQPVAAAPLQAEPVAAAAAPSNPAPAAAPVFPSATFTPVPVQALPSAPLVLNALAYEQESAIIHKGRGDRDTPKFALAGGSYLIRWEARVKSKGDDVCSFLARLKDEAVGGTFSTFADKRNITTSREDRALLEHVPSSQVYFFEVDSDCEWEIEIERD
jgi:hypothetical protein